MQFKARALRLLSIFFCLAQLGQKPCKMPFLISGSWQLNIICGYQFHLETNASKIPIKTRNFLPSKEFKHIIACKNYLLKNSILNNLSWKFFILKLYKRYLLELKNKSFGLRRMYIDTLGPPQYQWNGKSNHCWYCARVPRAMIKDNFCLLVFNWDSVDGIHEEAKSIPNSKSASSSAHCWNHSWQTSPRFFPYTIATNYLVMQCRTRH